MAIRGRRETATPQVRQRDIDEAGDAFVDLSTDEYMALRDRKIEEADNPDALKKVLYKYPHPAELAERQRELEAVSDYEGRRPETPEAQRAFEREMDAAQTEGEGREVLRKYGMLADGHTIAASPEWDDE